MKIKFTKPIDIDRVTISASDQGVTITVDERGPRYAGEPVDTSKDLSKTMSWSMEEFQVRLIHDKKCIDTAIRQLHYEMKRGL